jgi:hypothetical protein
MSSGGFENLAALANGCDRLIHRGRYLDVTFLVGIGSSSYLVRIHRGRVEAVDKGPFVMPRWTFALTASQETWATFWQPVPPPGGHDLFAMLKAGTLKLEGDQYPFMANLLYFKELLALPRGAAARGAGA